MNKNTESVNPGSSVTLHGEETKLYSENVIKVGDALFDHMSKITDNDIFKGKVCLVSVVPSVDTPVCELQTKNLNSEDNVNSEVLRVTVSRDLPMAQDRFKKAENIENITFLTDFNHAEFGKSTGLLMVDKGLLARAVIVSDKQGTVKYIQVVPEVADLPDMEKALEVARNLLG